MKLGIQHKASKITLNGTSLLSFKFSEQSRLEEEIGLEVSENMKFENLLDVYNDQLWFVGNMKFPL